MLFKNAKTMETKNEKRRGKAQPGYFAGYPSIRTNEYNCDSIFKRIKADNPSVKKTKFKKKCPKGFYKAFYALSLDGDTDYHFYRQDQNGLWSHKNSWRKATNKDAKGRLIKDPKKCDRGKFTIFCDYYMVKIT